jgi:hypothetical protein
MPPMKPIINITWEYPPWVVGSMSQELRRALPPAAKSFPISLVVRGDGDGTTELDEMRVYTVAQSVRDSPHVLAYAHALNIDLLRGACNAYHDAGGAQLIHTHDWVSSLAGAYLSANTGVPLAVSIYTTEVQRAGGLPSLFSMAIFDIERYCLSKAKWVIAVNEVAALRLTKEYAVPPSRLISCKGSLAIAYKRMGVSR